MPQVHSPKPRKPDMLDTILDHIEAFVGRFSTAFMVVGAATLGRLMYHADQVKRGKRAFWSMALAMDLIIAAGMGLIAWAGCEYVGLSGPIQAGLIAVAGYIGPHAIDVYVAQKQGTKAPPETADTQTKELT